MKGWLKANANWSNGHASPGRESRHSAPPPELAAYARRMAQEPFDPDDVIEPDGSASTEQVEYSEATHSVLTPMGQVESYGAFARGLGARRIKVIGALFLLAGIAVILVSEF